MILEEVRSSTDLPTEDLTEPAVMITAARANHVEKGSARSIVLDAYDNVEFRNLSTAPVDLDRWWQTPQLLLTDEAALTYEDVQQLPTDIRALIHTEYVLVIKTQHYDPPAYNSETDRYFPGLFSGTVHLYRLADGVRLASLSFSAEPETLDIMGMSMLLQSDDPQENLRTLRYSTYREIHNFALGRLTQALENFDSELLWHPDEDGWGIGDVGLKDI